MINIFTLCYSLYIHNFITHFLHVEKQRKLIKKKNKNEKLSRGGKNGVQHFIQRSCDQNGGWSSLLEDICAQGFLFQRLAADRVLLFVVYHQADGGYCNNLTIVINLCFTGCLHIDFLLLKFFGIYTIPSINFCLSQFLLVRHNIV